MNKFLAYAIIFASLMQVCLEANAFTGYYESFGDSNDPSLGCPVPEPTAWYSIVTCSGPYMNFGGSLQVVCNLSVSCGGSNVTGFSFQLANNVANNFTLDYDYSFSRENVTAPCNGVGVGFVFEGTAGWANLNIVSDLFTSHNTAGTCDNLQISNTCFAGSGLTTNTASSISGHVTIVYDVTTHKPTIFDSNLGTNTCTSTISGTVQGFHFNTLALQNNNGARDTASIDNLVWNDGNGTFNITTGPVTGSELDTGLKAFAAGLGFATADSQLLFSLILIGLTEILLAFLTGFFADGKWKVWTIHGVAATIGCICTLLGFMPFFVVIIGIVLGSTIVSGARETFNTLKSLARRVPGRPQPASEGGSTEPDMEPENDSEEPSGTVDERELETGTPETEPVKVAEPERAANEDA